MTLWPSTAACTLLLVLALGAGCGTPPAREAIPYQFRQSLLAAEQDNRSAPRAVGKRKAPPARKEQVSRPPLLARCRKQAGVRFAKPLEQARLDLIQACLGHPVSKSALRGQHLALQRSSPQPGNLVLFHNTRDQNANRKLDDEFTEVGVVVGLRGPLVEFIYLRPIRRCDPPGLAPYTAAGAPARHRDSGACREAVAAAGVLNLDQPNRRRLRGSRVQNTYLRIIQPGDAPATPYLAGQLLAGFAAPPSSR